jgi:catalase
MDRLKNPLSAENKAWWLGGGGGIPGNNRAVEFFNTLAYIGTPLKYRPSQTPSESLQDRKIKHMNNMMDYAASKTSGTPTFAALRAAVPKYNEIKDTITPRLTDAFDFGWFGKKSDEEKNSLEDQITAAAAEIRARMIQMAMIGQTSTIEVEMAKLIAEAKEAEEQRKAADAARKAAEAAAKGNGEPGLVDKAMTVFKGFF